MKKHLLTLVLCCVVSFFIMAQENSKRYEIKSGKITLTSEIFGTTQEMTIYFDDFGLLEYSSTVGEIMGFKINNAQIKKEGYLYDIDLNLNTCKKSKLEEGTPQNINFSNMTQKIIEDLKIEKTGTENFLDKVCEVWTMDHKDMRMKGTFLVWKGISLKTDMEVSGMVIRMKAKSIDTSSPLPKGIFEIPEGVSIIDADVKK